MVWVTVRSQQEKEQIETLEALCWAPSRKSLEGEKGMQCSVMGWGFFMGATHSSLPVVGGILLSRIKD